jgi:hypothetical protein
MTAILLHANPTRSKCMATSKPQDSTSRVLYGVSIQEAIASGDVAKMTAIREQAFTYMASVAEVERLLPALEAAIKTKGGPVVVLYAVTIQNAVARGDQAELARLRAEVAYYSRML